MPKPGPGNGAELPDITDATTLKDKMKFYNLLGHGSMYRGEHNVFLVPENTWILFVTRAGIPADKRKSGELRRVLDDFYFRRTGETILEWHERIYNGMRDGSLFSTILYSAANPDQFSIYEPGDLIQDLTIQFSNNHWPFMRLGVWECPLPVEVKEYLDTINNTVSIAEYNPDLRKIMMEEFPALLANPELAPHHSVIRKMIAFLQTYGSITAEGAMAFYDDPEVKPVLDVKENGNANLKRIKQIFNRATEIYDSSANFGQGLRNQYEFFNNPNNLVRYSSSAFDSDGTASNRLLSSLYTLLNEKKYVAPHSGARKPALSAENLLSTPKYRFIVVDACRSIEHLHIPKELYAPRAKLTRRLSNAARLSEGQVCFNTLLEMTRKRFDSLVQAARNAGTPINAASPIRRLLAGENVPLREFEESLVSPDAELRNVLSRPMKTGDTVFFIDGANGREGVILEPGLILSAAGQAQYTVMTENGETHRLPIDRVFRSEANILALATERVSEELVARNKEAELQREANAARLERITTKAQEKRLAKQKEIWDQRYKETITQRFSNKFGSMPTYRPREGQLFFTRVEKPGIPKNDTVNINDYFVKNGKIGYAASRGAAKRFYDAINLNTGEERTRFRTILNKIADPSKRFEKGAIVQISGVGGGGAFLNDKVGIVIDIYERGSPSVVLYRVQIKENDNTIKAYPLKPENLKRAPEGTNVGFPPIDPAFLPTRFKNLALSEENEAAIEAAAIREVNAANAAEGGRRHTYKRKQKKRKTRRASKH